MNKEHLLRCKKLLHYKLITLFLFHHSWKRFTTHVPYAAQVPRVRFKWQKVSNDEPNWALDNGKLLSTFLNIKQNGLPY